MKIGIQTPGLSEQDRKNLEKSVADYIETNNQHNKAIASSFDIQRRGQSLPGDTGHNFGLYDYGLQGFMGGGPYSNTYPGSHFFSGMFGGIGGGNGYLSGGGYGLGASSLWGFGAQGSHAGFRKNTSAAHQKMAMCVASYKGFGLAKNVIDLMANFAAEGLKIRHPSKTVERFLNRWAFHSNLQERVKDILRYYYKYGNVFIYRVMAKITEEAYTKMKRSRAKLEKGFSVALDLDPNGNPRQTEREGDVEKEKEKPLFSREIPWKYTLLNPFQMELRGSKFFGKHRWVFILDQHTINDMNQEIISSGRSYIDFLDKTDINLPEEFIKLSKEQSKEAPTGESRDGRVVELNQNNLYTMHYMKDDHEDWAEPLLWPVMADIHYKNKLRQMDISVCDSVINSITIFKLGSIKDGYIPPKEHLDKFAEFLRSPTQAMQMVWNDAISIDSSYPPVEKILSIAKYESVDRDILRGIGIPDSLIGGQVKSNFSTGFLGVRTLLERLEEGRNTVMRWLQLELELLTETLGFRKQPQIRFGKMSLRDEKAEKQLILQLLDRNIISIQAVLETFGEDFEIELERLKEEDQIRDDTGVFQKHSPYVDPINDMDMEEQLKKESEVRQQEKRLELRMRNKEKRNSGPNGRPGNSDGIPQEKQRETKPQGMAWLVEYEGLKSAALKRIKDAERITSKIILDARNKKTRRSLTAKEINGIEMVAFAVVSQNIGQITPSMVRKTMKENPVIPGDIYQSYVGMNVENASSDVRKATMASCIAIKLIEE